MNDWTTGTERDSATSAQHDAYPDPPAIERYELAAEQPVGSVDAEAEFWDGYPYGWPDEASDRIIADLHALCPECHGQGEVPTGRRIPADMFGPAEPITRRCGACNGTGKRETGDTA